jgi:hypothetical protein
VEWQGWRVAHTTARPQPVNEGSRASLVGRGSCRRDRAGCTCISSWLADVTCVKRQGAVGTPPWTHATPAGLPAMHAQPAGAAHTPCTCSSSSRSWGARPQACPAA